MASKTSFQLSVSPVGSKAATLYLAQPTQPTYPTFWQTLIRHLQDNIDGIIDTVPAYGSLFVDCVHADALQAVITSAKAFAQQFSESSSALESDNGLPTQRIPVCYDQSFAPDLAAIASANHLTIEQVIDLHTAPTYQVYALGFIPGFAFLGYVDEQIAAPRHQNPRAEVAAGSVGIAGRQTGVYPATSPGGWQIIGRTPITLYDPAHEIYSLFEIASRVQFYPITLAAFNEWGKA